MKSYGDILHLPRPEIPAHPRMLRKLRAAQRQRHVAQTSELRRIVLVVRSEDGPAVIITNINNALRLFGRALFEFFYLSVGEYTAQSPFYLAP